MILPIPEEKKEEAVSTWTCDCGWESNKVDALTCYICQEPRPDQQTDETKVDASTNEELDPTKTALESYFASLTARNPSTPLINTYPAFQTSLNTSTSSSGDTANAPILSLLNANPAVQTSSNTSTSSPASTSNTSNGSSSTAPLVQTTSTSVIQVSNDSEVVPFSQFVNAYVMKNIGSDSVDRMRADARSFYDSIKNDPSTLLEAFQSFQL